MQYTEEQNKTAKVLISAFFRLENCKKLIDYRDGVFEFIFTDRKFRVDINNIEKAVNTLKIWKNLYKPKNGAM